MKMKNGKWEMENGKCQLKKKRVKGKTEKKTEKKVEL